MSVSLHHLRIARVLLALVCAIAASHVHAAFVVGETRVVFAEGVRFKTLMVGNTGETATAIQAWIDSGSEGPHKSTAPFLVSPPVVLLKRGDRRLLNIFHNGSAMPADRESLFWLNLLEVPPVPQEGLEDNRLNVALNLQLKLLYRPASLVHDQRAILDKLSFHLRREGAATHIAAENRSPFVVSFARWDFVLADGGSKSLSQIDLTLLPFSGRVFPLTPDSAAVVTSVRAQVIGDRGEIIERTFPVN
ncbi:fimbrial biogenesis chaperone [Diaphorobacter aerolatus]|uniref:Molecular chaperone n=1 Tax=Diaphorobacter aerolatus TaxID=1288495 RepID=A0A7H0GME7_9BURK|nr:molecular chaperone [Diaphorobacter aerolatus]QNP49463.1 molecular chaperone [Diaphorobacter aerolatus]